MTPKPAVITYKAFTARGPGRLSKLITDVQVWPAFDPTGIVVTPQSPRVYKALYDTGATNSAISPRVVGELNLPDLGATKVGVAGGEVVTTSHVVNILLPNGVGVAMVRVAALHVKDVDALIGMDILGLGDFSVTNHHDKTAFSFCYPSRQEIDFVKELHAMLPKAGRNDPCPCGSGKKYKKCHGQ